VVPQFDNKTNPISETLFPQFNSNITWSQYILLTRIRIVLCRDKKDAMVEMMLPEKNKHIFAGKYKTVLPSKDELKHLLEEQ